MPAAIERYFSQATQQVTSPRRWVIGHSGGLDSQVLLHLAQRILLPEQLFVLHVNHHLQSDAGKWAGFSADQAKNWHLEHQTIDAFPQDRSESSARKARYEAFSSVLVKGDCLLLAHHADDQAETMLYRMLRGAGLRGLAGMPQQRPIADASLLRPLLGVTRQQLEKYANDHALQWIDDPSNSDVRYDRNFLRQDVLPVLQQRWPGFKTRWVNTAAQLRETEAVLNQYLDSDIRALTGRLGEISVTALLDLPRNRRFHLLRRWGELAAGLLLNPVQLSEIDKTVLNARLDAQPQLNLGAVILRRYRHALYLTSNHASVRESLSEIVPGDTYLSDGILKVERSAAGLSSLEGLRLVRRQGGERCRPVGRGGSCSVKKCLQEAGIPPWLKQDWPLLMSGDEVVAVPGICICEGWQSKSSGFAVSWCSFALSDAS